MDRRDTLEDAARLLSVHAHAKGLEVTLADRSRICRRPSQGDAGRIRQILLNLGGNAVKFTHKGEARSRSACFERGAGRVRSLRSARHRHRHSRRPHQALFSPFTQVDSSTTRRFGGTGLGLPIARRLVDLMGGEVGVTSREGAGSTFLVHRALQAGSSGDRRVLGAVDIDQRQARAGGR